MNSLNQEEIKLLLDLIQKMNLKQLQKLKEIIPKIEKNRVKLESILNDLNKLFEGETQ